MDATMPLNSASPDAPVENIATDAPMIVENTNPIIPASLREAAALYLSDMPPGLGVANFDEMRSSAAFQYLSNPLVMQTARNFLFGVCNLASPALQRPNIKVVIAAFSIKRFHGEIFESMGTLETSLHTATVAFLQHTHDLAVALQTNADPSNAQLATFAELLDTYLRDFAAWKQVDVAKLGRRLRRALLALHNTLDYLVLNDPNSDEARRVRDSIDRIRNKLSRACGQQALEAFDAEMAARVVEPRNAVTSLTIASDTMNNDNIVYEMLLDGNFKIDINDAAFFKVYDNELVAAFYDLIVEELSRDPPSITSTIKVLDSIRTAFFELVPANQPLHEEMSILLNTANIRASNLLLDNTTSMQLFADIVDLLKRAQKAERSEETKELWEPLQNALHQSMQTEMLKVTAAAKRDVLKFLFDRVNTMRFDAANDRLASIAPILKVHGIPHLRQKFTDKYGNPVQTLQWLSKQMDEGTVQRLALGDEATLRAVHRSGIVDFIVAPDPAALPEVLVYDARRIKSFHDSYENFVDNATLIHVIGQWVGKLQEDAVVRKEEVPSLLGMVSHMVIAHSATTEEEITVLHGFIEQVAPAVEEDISTSLLRNMKEALSPTYEGRIIVSEFIKDYWKKYSPDNVDSEAMASFYAIGDFIRGEAAKIDAMVTMNLKVFGPILTKLTLQLAGEAGAQPVAFNDTTMGILNAITNPVADGLDDVTAAIAVFGPDVIVNEPSADVAAATDA